MRIIDIAKGITSSKIVNKAMDVSLKIMDIIPEASIPKEANIKDKPIDKLIFFLSSSLTFSR